MKSRLTYVTIDSNNLERDLDFWVEGLDGTSEPFGDGRDETYRRIALPNSDTRLVLQLVPEPKTAKTRVHVCIESDDVEAEGARLQTLGASLISQQGEFGRPLLVLADPSGNEFCLIQPVYEGLLGAQPEHSAR